MVVKEEMVLLSSCSPPDEGIRKKQENTSAFVGEKALGKGTLFIAESCLSWQSSEHEGQGFSLQYPGISIHAVSRDLTAFPHECLYLMVEGDLTDDANREDEESDDEDIDPSTEMRFVPDDKTVLDQLYKAMSDCQILHPDEDDSDFDEGGFYEGEDGFDHLSEQGQANLQRMENLLGQGDGQLPNNNHAENGDDAIIDEQFEDADEDDDMEQ
ncbi:methylosome subunit pICln-like isoform X5 [Mytilus californianus]|uniref:methylosome subunit pICln-like isoform X1 n=1 Tax=Mytilus californianus TaxID=6549 RepID=UPI0022453B3E|nr:methylosome subunit pICln-like isoform X1 [Mytilus californianus]XP_052107119.1 methylosome subunit pICln-like isoform X2 [Mytilus californianus]XP_052107120.1 methylosome subunit pICln-like isoform X3 [Mytilus californianus]XP_052107121.1 methylosome subunit pICln-like isoform X4 [Mytilus californianus]XP_052107123.1 methylosome subunit pICln-like isoform X5 [Mytilus californianus]